MKCPHCEKELTQVGDLWVCPDHKIVEPQKNAQEAATAENKPRLFLSYGRRDAKDLADRLSVDLTAAGYEVWRDTSEIRAGHSWEAQIEDGLRSTQLLIALLSPPAVRKSTDPDSPDHLDSVCLDEISFARFARPPIPIVPAMVSQCDPPFCIFRLDYVDLTSWSQSDDQYRDGLQRLLDGIEAARRNEIRYRSWMHRLKPLDVFDAYLNEKRQDFCGREWLFDEIEAWRLSSRERALLITGDPGVGKSAIVAQLVHLNPGAQLLAYHCCMADTPETLRPARFVRSLAAMIGSRLPDYAEMLETTELQEQLSVARCNEDAADAFESGILARLEGLAAPDEGVRYILIDALDEVLTLRESSKTIVDLLTSRLNRLPSWLRIVATTRKEPEVLRKLSSLRAETIDASDPRNLEDIDNYIAARLQTPNLAERLVAARVTLAEVQRRLREAGDGNFLYVKQALIDIERDNYRFDQLEDLPQGLTGLYDAFFARQFGATPASGIYGPTRRVLEVAVAAQQPPNASQLARATGLEEYELEDVLRKLATFLPERDEFYALYHKSLGDWLTQSDNPYRASPKRGHAQLAEMCWCEYERNVDRMSRYALAFVSEHLIAAQRWGDLETVLTDLRYIQAACKAGIVFDLVRDYNYALTALPELQQERAVENERQRQLKQYGEDLISYAKAKGKGVALPTPPDTREARISMRRVEAALDSQEAESGVPPRRVAIQSFANFVSLYCHQLNRFADQVIPTAFNHASDGFVAHRAEELVDSLQIPWLKRVPRPPALPNHPVCLRTLEGHTRGINSVSLTPDGYTAVSSAWDGTPIPLDRTLRVWDIASGECLRTLAAHVEYVFSIALTPDGNTAVAGCRNNHLYGRANSLRVWDIASGECVRTLEGHTDHVSSVALTPDGYTAVSASEDKTLRVWDIARGERARTLEGRHAGRPTSVALTPDGKLAVSASRDRTTIRILDTASGECVRTLEGHTRGVTSVSLTPVGNMAVSGSEDKTLRVWNITSGECVRTLQGRAGVTCLALTSDGTRAISGCRDNTLRIWDITSGECLRTLEGHGKMVTCVALTSDGNTAVSGSFDTTLRVWDIKSGECLRTLEGHSHCMFVAIMPDGNTAVSVGEGDRLGFSVCDIASGERFPSRTGNRFEFPASSPFMTPDGKMGVFVCSGNTLRILDIKSRECLRTLEGHESFSSVAIMPMGNMAVSASKDNTLSVWGITDGNLIAFSPLEAPITWVTASSSYVEGFINWGTAPPSNRIVVGTNRDQLYFFTLRNGPKP